MARELARMTLKMGDFLSYNKREWALFPPFMCIIISKILDF